MSIVANVTLLRRLFELVVQYHHHLVFMGELLEEKMQKFATNAFWKRHELPLESHQVGATSLPQLEALLTTTIVEIAHRYEVLALFGNVLVTLLSSIQEDPEANSNGSVARAT